MNTEHHNKALEHWEHEVLRNLDTLKAKGVVLEGKKLLLAVSGGVDSMALLYFWHRVGCDYYRCSVGVAHVHHGLRNESDLEYEQIREICKHWSIPFYGKKLIKETRTSNESIEMWGRKERYQFFQQLIEKHNFTYILTAHHREDQLETLFLRLWRGTGMRGLQGIHYYREPNIIRPFLHIKKNTLKEYCVSRSVPWWEDKTNLDENIQRNWLRNHYLPSFGDTHKMAEQALHITRIAQSMWPILEQSWKKEWSLEEEFPCLCRDKVSKWMQKDPWLYFPDFSHLVFSSGCHLEEAVYEEWVRQWQNNVWPVKVSLDSHHSLVCDSNGARVDSLSIASQKINLDPIEVDISGSFNSVERTWGTKRVRFCATRRVKPECFVIKKELKQQKHRVYLDGKLLTSTLILRTRRDGDIFAPLGTPSKTRKLKNYLNERKVPIDERNTSVLVCDSKQAGTVIWAPFLEISEFYKVKPETEELLELEIQWL